MQELVDGVGNEVVVFFTLTIATVVFM